MLVLRPKGLALPSFSASVSLPKTMSPGMERGARIAATRNAARDRVGQAPEEQPGKNKRSGGHPILLLPPLFILPLLLPSLFPLLSFMHDLTFGKNGRGASLGSRSVLTAVTFPSLSLRSVDLLLSTEASDGRDSQ